MRALDTIEAIWFVWGISESVIIPKICESIDCEDNISTNDKLKTGRNRAAL